MTAQIILDEALAAAAAAGGPLHPSLLQVSVAEDFMELDIARPKEA